MKTPSFDSLKKLPLRNAFPHEAHDFTPWLCDNLPGLGDALGLDLELVEREAAVGGFSLDILAKDLGTNSNVVIENMFGASNHDHLGKLLTYVAGFTASTAIWIAEDFRPEHTAALDYINQRTDTDTRFFAVVMEILQIGDSSMAPNFRVVVAPNEWNKTSKLRKVSGGSQYTTQRAERYRDYFQSLIDDLRENHHFTNARAAQRQSWYAFSSGFTNLIYGANFAQGGKVRTELYLNREPEENEVLFDALYKHSKQIESDLGELEWERLEGRKASRIVLYRDGSIDDDSEALETIHRWHIENLLKFREVFTPLLRELA
ncbi:MAG: DUF4268 domain-containing protein [Candidatus Thiodiazotropha taylori]